MNYKYWFKNLVEVKDLMLNVSGGLAKVIEYDGVNTFWNCPIHVIKTSINLGGNKITLKEEYLLNKTRYKSDICADYTLTVEKLDGCKSILDLAHWFGAEPIYCEYDKDDFQLYKNSGFFDRMKPSELPVFYRTWYHLCYDRRERENYYKKVS